MPVSHAAATPCTTFHRCQHSSRLYTTRQHPCLHAAERPGMHGVLQARAVLHSLRQGRALVTLCLRLHQLHLPVVSELSGAGTLRQLYRRAMQMEVDFFSAQPGISSAPSVGMLVVDFDDTCTATDTTSQVFNAAIAANAENAPGSAGPRKTTHAFCTSCPGQSQQRGNCNAGSSMHLKYEYRLHCPLE